MSVKLIDRSLLIELEFLFLVVVVDDVVAFVSTVCFNVCSLNFSMAFKEFLEGFGRVPFKDFLKQRFVTFPLINIGNYR